MIPFQNRLFLVFTCLLLGGVLPLLGQSAPATNTPATNAPPAAPAVKPYALGDIVTQAQVDDAKIKGIQAKLDPDEVLQEVGENLPKVSSAIDAQTAKDTAQAETATLNGLQTSQANWQELQDTISADQTSLAKRVQDLNQFTWDLNQMGTNWQATRDSANAGKAPPEILTQIKEVQASVAATLKSVQDHLSPLYSMQTKVAAQDARAKTAVDAVTKQLSAAQQQLFVQNRPALWKPEAFAQTAGGVVGQEKATLVEQDSEVGTYLKAKTGAVLVHILIFVMLVIGFFWIRNVVDALAKEEIALQDASHIFRVPFANAMLIALLAAGWLYPGQPPRLFLAALGAVALIPAIVVTRRLIDPSSFPILYAAIIAFLVDQVRYVVTPAGVAARMLFILELLAASIFLLAAFRFKHLAASDPEQTRLKRLTRLYLHIAFFVLVVAGLANVFGYIKLSILLGNGMLESSYLAVILYAALRIVDALAISALSIRPLSRLGMVRRHRDLLYTNTTIAMRWIFFAIWLAAALRLFSLLGPVWQNGYALLWKQTYSYFSIPFTIGDVLAFPFTIWASFLISRFIRFLLEEEVYPHMSLGRGVPYAASTMVHYLILVIGFFAAVAATGAELSQFAFLAGAFGVGLGFGLQNIMNNFVSGVILLFERPIKVGDMVQIGTDTGTVERIGIRASVILLANGAEVIVPNGNLISNPVTNWTLSNCERQIEIPVVITSKVDPQHVIDLLTKVAGAHPSVLKNPAPHAYLVTFAAASLSFRLSAWIDSADESTRVTSDLSLAVNSALAKENIALG
jgi:potassium efflux system protein